jgi:hypothetical protein
MKHYSILILLVFTASFSQAQSPCLPEDKAALQQIDLYIKGLQDDPARFNSFIDRVLQHPEYTSVIQPIIERISQEASARINTTEDVKTLLTENDWLQIREIVCSLMIYDVSAGSASAGGGAPPSGGQTPTSPTTSAPTVPLAKIWSSRGNKEYSNGDVMEVPYKSTDEHLAFALKNYPANTETFQWSYIENDQDITALVKNSEPTVDNFGVNIAKRSGPTKLKVKYGNNEVVIEIKINKKPFGLTDLSAYPQDKPKRKAIAGQTLYLVDGDAITVSDKVVYDATFDPDLAQSLYAPSDIIWKYNDQTQYRYEQLELGKKKITRTLEEDNATLKTSVEGGYPNKITKSVDVKWINGTIKNFAFVPPATSAVITKTFETVDNNLKLVDKYVNIGVKLKVEPIKITGRLYNQADPDSRLYREVKYGNITAGAKAETNEKPLTLPIFQALKRMEIADVGLYVKAEFGFYLIGGMEMYKYAESGKENGTLPFMEFTARGCIEAGIKAKLLVGTDLVDFEVKGYAQACLAGVLRFKFDDQSFTGKLTIPPVVVGIKAKVKTKGVLEFDMVDYNASYSVIDEIILFQK